MAITGNITFPTVPGLEPHHQSVQCHIQVTCWGVGGLNPLQKCSRYILSLADVLSNFTEKEKIVKIFFFFKLEMGFFFLSFCFLLVCFLFGWFLVFVLCLFVCLFVRSFVCLFYFSGLLWGLFYVSCLLSGPSFIFDHSKHCSTSFSW